MCAMEFRFPEKYRPSTVTKACKSRGHRWTNSLQILNLCTCWRVEICGVIVVGQIFDAVIIPILPKLRPSTFQTTLVPSGTKRGFSSNGLFKTLGNTRNQADFAPRTHCPPSNTLIWRMIKTVIKCHKMSQNIWQMHTTCCFEVGLIFHCSSAELLAAPPEFNARWK